MPTGRTSEGTWQAGARRTLPLAEERAWSGWAEPPGLGRWVPELAGLAAPLREGEVRELQDGIVVTAVRVRPPAQLRLRVARPGASPFTLQLRILAATRGVTVAFHAEGLPDASRRQALLDRWHDLLAGA